MLTDDGQDSVTLDEPKKKLFAIRKPQGQLWNKRPFLVNTCVPVVPPTPHLKGEKE